MTPSYSYLGTPDEILGSLEDAGFKIVENLKEGGGAAGTGALPPGALAPSVIMGPDMPERIANTARSAQEDRLVSMLIAVERPA